MGNYYNCKGCCHDGHCTYFSDPEWTQNEVAMFEKHCVGCCCGEGCECNRDNGCSNYETEPILG